MIISNGTDYSAEVNSKDAVLAELKQLDDHAYAISEPQIVTLYSDPRDDAASRLSVAVGAPLSLLGWYEENGDEIVASFSIGERKHDKSAVYFRYGNTNNEYQARMLISRDEAWNSAAIFYETKRRPDNVHWEDL